MGLARIALAVLAVVVALGLLVVGGIALWGALTKDTSKSAPSPTETSNAPPAAKPQGSQSQSSLPALVLKCLAAQCKAYVAGPGPTDVQFNGYLSQGMVRLFDDQHLSLVVDDASGVQITINGHVQPQGPHGRRTFQITKQG